MTEMHVLSEFTAASLPSTLTSKPFALGPFCDIGLNICDDMFKGVYNGKQRHENDSNMVFERARSMGVSRFILTAGTIEDSRWTLDFTRKMKER